MTMPDGRPAGRKGWDQRFAAQRLAQIATKSTKSLARIARAYEQFETGRCDQARLLAVVQRETKRAAEITGRAKRPSRPVRG